MYLDKATYEIKEKSRQHDKGDDSTVNILRYVGGAKGKIVRENLNFSKLSL